MNLLQNYWLDILALILFFVAWNIFSYRIKYSSKHNKHSLSNMLGYYRDRWMYEMLNNKNRVVDMQLLALFERNCIFFASSALLIIAGLLTSLGSIDKIATIAQGVMPVIGGSFLIVIDGSFLGYKIILLLLVFVYAFFSFTWSMRQFGFAGFIVVSTPSKMDGYNKVQRQRFAEHTSTLVDFSARSFQKGMTAYYYSLAVLGWMIHPILFILGSIIITLIIDRREFRSRTINILAKAHDDLVNRLHIDENTK